MPDVNSLNRPLGPDPPSDLVIKADDELQQQIVEIAKEANGKVGVYALLIEQDRSISLNGNERFAMQSVVKLPISMAVLKQVDEGKLKLDQKIQLTKDDFVPSNMRSPIRDKNPNGAEITIQELIRFAISESDGTAADVLQRVAGGAKGVQEYIAPGRLAMNVKYSHKEFGRDWQFQYENWCSPEAAVMLLDILFHGEGGTKSNADLLLKFMTESNNPPNRIKGMLPPGTVVAHKTGTSGTRDGLTAATNDIGLIYLPNGQTLAIAIFVGDSTADEKTREAIIAKIAKAVWDKWSK
ncbi:MAG TPA: class A beta-lactamase [Pyrinomonadaceae bacterium]|nr:class A beta-lactamase [Pyrinomonadaceae bacterium]